ncbi:MAG: undecaprenyl/decaprenyl-phosphate alpha-N-acetylglucosaminyl 1-phosphate transferase [Bacteroidales bacterium]|nr:undecaprenyl/decaprenyl-phosphate alpha-N-acetylglucosaminyl 1-phosphate transferase [Bacteroidales bacterium]
MSVFVAATGAILLANFVVGTNTLFIPVVCLIAMFFVGIIDDMVGISYVVKFAFQVVLVFLLWYFGFRIDTLGGILGIHRLGLAPSLVLSLLAGVGLINAMNLIDGVDGLASGLGVYSGLICGIIFLLHYDAVYAVLSMSFVGALLPFFVHNVFSKKYKMFIGDSGSLVLGMLAYLFTCRIIHLPYLYLIDDYSISMMLAIYAVPVYDTLRVMTFRILHGHSPFLPDKTHLHHVFISMKYPHVLVTCIILTISVIIFLIWFGLTWLELSITWTTVISVTISAMIVWLIYIVIDRQRFFGTRQYARQVALARYRTKRISRFYYRMQCLVDRKHYPAPWKDEKKTNALSD